MKTMIKYLINYWAKVIKKKDPTSPKVLAEMENTDIDDSECIT